MRSLEPSHSLTILRVLLNLDISIDTVLSQSLLQMIRYSINDLNVNEYYILMKLLRKHKSQTRSSLTDAVALALPHAFNNLIINKEIDFHHIPTLLKCIDLYSFFGIENFERLDAFDKCLHFLKLKASECNIRNSIRLLSIIYSLNLKNIEHFKNAKIIIEKCIENIKNSDTNELHNLPAEFFINVLVKMRNNHFYYNKTIFDIVFEKIDNCQLDVSIDNLYSLLKQNWNFSYVNYNLLKHFATLIEHNDPKLLEQDKISLLTILRTFTLASDYQSIHSNLDLICEHVRTSNSFLNETKNSKMSYFNFILNCLMLNVKLNESLLIDWFSNHLTSAVMESNIKSQR